MRGVRLRSKCESVFLFTPTPRRAVHPVPHSTHYGLLFCIWNTKISEREKHNRRHNRFKKDAPEILLRHLSTPPCSLGENKQPRNMQRGNILRGKTMRACESHISDTRTLTLPLKPSQIHEPASCSVLLSEAVRSRAQEKAKNLGSVSLADVVDGNAVGPRVLARPRREVANVLHNLFLQVATCSKNQCRVWL